MRLRISPADNRPDTAVVRVGGVVDSTTLEEFFRAISGTFTPGVKNLLLDVSGMSYISSGGLSVLQDAYKQAGTRGGQVVIVGAGEQIKELFSVVGFHRIFVFYRDIDAALEALKPAARGG